MPQLNVALVPAPDQVVVRLTGDADLSTAPLVADALTQARRPGHPAGRRRLAGARFWDCSGLRTLADFTGNSRPTAGPAGSSAPSRRPAG